MKIQGNTFIITGGLGGIGSTVAKSLLQKGGKVALFDVVDEAKGKELASAIGDNSKVLYVKVNISDSDETKEAVSKVVSTLGDLKGCVHCAAISLKRPWTNDMADSIPDFIKTWNVNTLGTFIVNAHVADAINYPLNHPNGAETAPFWTSNEERGVIVNFSSAAAHGLYARTLCYGPTKAAVAGITRTAADFLGPSGIRVNSISPSIVMSAMTNNLAGYFQKDLQSHAAFPQVPVPPEEISRTVEFIIENGWINGEDIRVDGAWRLVFSRDPDGADPRTLAPGLE
ncbi:hypothetical protein TRVA0_005S02476 [Trichomonascus vanleenenianus]|uniref:uncharacterized protein n=1 Tax=Trichomonascus vanleenenianus TaxID=2268995 RepID=UPI003EC952EE